MNTYVINFPPMPKPEDFGITDGDWDQETDAKGAKIGAYKEAVKAWKEAAMALRGSQPTT